MVFESILLATAFGGTTLAALWDLKTTEIPDQIPNAMVITALIIYGIQSYMQGSYWPILTSIISGISMLAFGFILYYLGQWGGGDAKVLAAVGFLLQSGTVQTIFPFQLTFLMNVFIVGAAYMIIYSIIFALMNKKILSAFYSDLKSSINILIIGTISLFVLFMFFNFYLANYFSLAYDFRSIIYNSLLPVFLTGSLYMVWKFAKAVENVGFRKKISLSKLKVGDVLMESKVFEGITARQLSKIKKSGKKFVWVKEGVRFAPAFPLALLFTLYVGDAFLLLRYLF